MAGAEHLHHAVALPLLHAAVQRLRAMAVRLQRLDDRLDFEARPAEDQRGGRILHVEHAIERRRLVRARDDVGDLPHAGQLAGRRLLARDRHARRILQVPLRDRQDPRRHRRREQRRLPRLRRRLEDRVQILGEAHVEHLVRFVQHQHAQVRELQRAALDVIQGASRRGDDDAGAAFERADLLRDRRAAVDRQHGDAEAPGVLVDRFRHLHRQLTRRHEHEPAGLLSPIGLAAEPLEHRQREGGGLAGAGGRLPEQILAGDQERDGLALDRRRLLVPERRDRGSQLVDQPEPAEPAGCAFDLLRGHTLHYASVGKAAASGK